MTSEDDNKLKSLEGLPRLVGEFRFGETKLKTLEGFPQVGRDVDLRGKDPKALQPLRTPK